MADGAMGDARFPAVRPGHIVIRITPLILAVALFMENMDSTVIATSLPAIAADIGTNPIALKLALTAYFVSLAIFIPISGWMADRFGASNIFRIAIAIFVVGSIACAYSNSLQTFVFSRFLQGVGGSMMTPIARLVLLRVTPRNELVSAMAWLTIPGLIGPLTGPPVGGFLTTYLSWHWIFWINVPIGVIGILLASRFLPKSEPRIPRPIDFLGFFLCGIAFSGIIFGLSVISLPAIPTIAGYAAVVIGAVAAVLYLLHARRTKYPLLDPRLFRHPYFRTAVIGGSVLSHRHRRVSVSHAADAAARLRTHAVRVQVSSPSCRRSVRSSRNLLRSGSTHASASRAFLRPPRFWAVCFSPSTASSRRRRRIWLSCSACSLAG